MGDAPSGWEKKKFSELLNVRDDKQLATPELPLYSLTIEDGVCPKGDRYNREFLVKDSGTKLYKTVRHDDLVFNPAGTGGIRFPALQINGNNIEGLRTNDDIRLYKLFSSNTYGDPHFERNKILNGINVEDNLTKFQLFETQTHLQSLLLRSDKMMMSSSIEARVPYLDKNLFNFSLNINKNIKKNNKQKIVLKKILSDLGYTKKFIERKKVGYIVPYNNWIKLKKNFKKDLNNEVLINLFNKENLDKLSVNLSKKKNIYSNAKFYWLLTNLNEYVKIFRINY